MALEVRRGDFGRRRPGLARKRSDTDRFWRRVHPKSCQNDRIAGEPPVSSLRVLLVLDLATCQKICYIITLPSSSGSLSSSRFLLVGASPSRSFFFFFFGEGRFDNVDAHRMFRAERGQ